MPRPLVLFVLSLALTTPAFAQGPCHLDISLTCINGNCASVTRNVGATTCSGLFISKIAVDLPPTQASVTGFQDSLGLPECLDSSSIPEDFVFGACIGEASLYVPAQ